MTNDSEPSNRSEVTTKRSPRSVDETVDRLVQLLTAKGVKLFAVIDQQAEARDVGLELRETVLVIFGSPVAGTPVMVESPLAALDLPLKFLIWSSGNGTNVSYLEARVLAARYGLNVASARPLAAVETLASELLAPDL